MDSLKRLLVTGALAAVSIGTASAAELWQGYTYIPSAANPEVQRFEQAAKAIGEATKNQLRVRVTAGGGLPIKGDDIQQAIADDVIQYGQVTGTVVSFLPIYGLSRVPGLYSNREEYQKASAILTPYYKRHLEAKGIVYLGQYFYPEQTVFSRSDNVKELADLKGLKVRVSSPQQGTVVRAYGGVPVTLATPEVAPALQQGRVDAVLTANAGGGRIWIDLLKANYRIVVNWSSGLVIANKKRYEALPPDQRAAVDKISVEMANAITKDLIGQEDHLIAQFTKEKGMKYFPPKPQDTKDIARLSAPMWDEEAKKAGPDGLKALADIRKALGK